MSMLVQTLVCSEEVDVLAGALYAWCAEREVKLASPAGLAAANRAIDLYDAGHHTQEDLLSALHDA